MADAATQAMAAMIIEVNERTPPKVSKGTKGVSRRVVTNSFPVTLAPNRPFFLYDFRVNAVFVHNGAERLMEVTKQSRNDYDETTRKEVAWQAYTELKNLNLLRGDFSYDRAALLISMTQLPQCEGGDEFVTDLTPATAPNLFLIDKVSEATAVRVTIKKASDRYQVSSNDLQEGNEATRKALLNVINLATSQEIFDRTTEFVVYGNGNAYLLNPQNFGFPSSFDVGSNDKYGGIGLTKGARLIEGPNGTVAVAITVDVKKSAFHADDQLVFKKLADMGCAEKPVEATAGLAGLKAYVVYSGASNLRSREITIAYMGHERVRDVTFTDANGQILNLAQYVQTRYQTRLNPNAYVIVDKYDGNKYSPETLKIAPNQRVKSENAQPATTEKLIRQSATLPAVRQAETNTLARALNITDANLAQSRRGVTVNTNTPITVMARVLDKIMIGTGKGLIPASGPWSQGKIAQVPLAHFNKWTVVHINNPAFPEADTLASKTAKALEKRAGEVGYDMHMSLNIVVEMLETDQEAQMERIFAAEKAAGSKFILVIANNKIRNHQIVKRMEIKNDIVTEQIQSSVAQKIPDQSNTAANVVLKICEKLGGQTHYISKTTTDLPAWVTQKGTMIVGLQMEHPSALSGREKESNAMPSCPVFIGFSSNAVRGAKDRAKATSDEQMEKEATHFNSDWSYAMTRDYQDGQQYYQSYKEVVLNILRSFKKYRDCVPGKIILFRGGVAEGDYAKVRNEEVAIWEAAFKTLNPKYNPLFFIVTVSEMHSDRFYQERIPVNEKAPRQNLPTGTVIDSVVTNPALSQVFLQSHVALQGTVKTPSYVVQHLGFNPGNVIPVTMDDITRIAHALCFAHGVCNTPTAVPTPLYIAQDSMKRAAEMFLDKQKRSGVRTWNLEEVKRELTRDPETSQIHGMRVNA